MPHQSVESQQSIAKPHDAGEPIVRASRNGARWWLRAGAEALVLGEEGPDWFDLSNDPRSELVKRGYFRAIRRVTLGTETLYAKVIEHRPGLRGAIALIAGDAARREWRLIHTAEARGVPVTRAIALGVLRRRSGRIGGGESRSALSVLLTEGLVGATRLADLWLRQPKDVDRRTLRLEQNRLIDAMASLFSKAHEHGFRHGDAHPGNILAVETPGQGPELRFADLATARFSKRPVNLVPSLDSLAQLDQFFRHRATRAQRLRFLRGYLAQRPSLVSTRGRNAERRLLAMFAKCRISHFSRLARRRDRRLRRNGKYFTTLGLGGGWKATVALELERRHRFPEEAIPDRSLDDWRGILEPIFRSIDQAPTSEGTWAQDGLTIELGPVRRLSSRLVGTRNRRKFEACHRLRHRDIPSELILGYASRRRCGVVDATALIRARCDEAPAGGDQNQIEEPMT